MINTGISSLAIREEEEEEGEEEEKLGSVSVNGKSILREDY